MKCIFQGQGRPVTENKIKTTPKDSQVKSDIDNHVII